MLSHPDWHREVKPVDLSGTRLVSRQETRIRDLIGFRKSHRVPSEYTSHTQQFVARIGTADLQKELDDRFDDFRRHLGFRRLDMEVDDSSTGTARITTPWFDYTITVNQNPESFQDAIFRKTLSNFRNIQALKSDGLATVFGNAFRTVETDYPNGLVVEDLIDRIEASQDQNIKIDYDRQATWCSIQIESVAASMRVTADQLSLTAWQPIPPAALLDAFCQFQNAFPALNIT